MAKKKAKAAGKNGSVKGSKKGSAKGSSKRKSSKKSAGKKNAKKGAGKKAAGSSFMSEIDAELHSIEEDIKRFKGHVESPPEHVEPVAVRPEPKKVVSASRLESAVEREVEEVKEERRFEIPANLGSLFLYFVSSLVFTAVLAFLFGSGPTFLFYFAFGIFLWWWSHRFHKEDAHVIRPFLSLGSLVVFLYLSYLLFGDLLSLLVCVVYSLSFVVAGVLFFYHTKKELSGEIHRSFPRTFLVVFYSHVIALAAASAVAYLIGMLLLSGSFMSVGFLILAWLLPSLLVYFFLTKFLYLRFFDQVHIKRDVMKGLGHALIYSVVFIVLLLMAYLLTAMQFVAMEKDSYEDAFAGIFADLQNVRADIQESAYRYDSPELMGLRVSQDVLSLSDELYRNATGLRIDVSRTAFSFWDYLSDAYFAKLVNDRQVVSSVSVFTSEVEEVKEDLFREYERLKRQQDAGVFDDGSTSLEGHYDHLFMRVADLYMPYGPNPHIEMLRARIRESSHSFEELLADGELLEFNMVYHPDMEVFLPGDSRFSRMFYDIVYHTAIFRDLMVFGFNTITFNVKETVDPFALRAIYVDADESLLSGVLRLRVIRSDLEATLSLADEADVNEVKEIA